MSKTSKTRNSKLKEGMDSGDISQKTKLYVAFNSGGKCYFPNCPKHLTLEGTSIGQCAHIIPKKVGFVREDWQTPLEDRRKAANLIYVCSEHHLVIDNPDNVEKYSANELRTWKEKHEAWALSQDKDTPNVPEAVRKRLEGTISSLSHELAAETKISIQLLTRLLAESKTLLRRRYLEKAEVLLSQVEILLSETNNADLSDELLALQANLLWKRGKIPQSKALYLGLLGSSDHVEGLFDYVELCDAVPEDGDRAAEYEEKARHTAPDHPRLKLIDLNRQYQQEEKHSAEIREEKWTSDDWLNGKFYLTYALFFDLAGDFKKRDRFITQWEKLLPESPRPNLFRILFMTVEAYRNGIKSSKEALALLKEIQEQEEDIFLEGKDPLSPHDRITLLVNRVRVYGAVLHFSVGKSESLGETRDELLDLINGSYFDKHINLLLPDVLSTVLLSLPQWKGLTTAILASKVAPSIDLIDLLFFQGINLCVDSAELRELIVANSRSDLSDLLDAVEQKDVTSIIEAINGKEEKFKLVLLRSINDTNLLAELVENLELSEYAQTDKLYFQLAAYDATGNAAAALALAKQVSLQEITPAFLGLVNHVAYKYGEQKLAVESGEKLLGFDLPDEYRIELHGKLATAYSRSHDDRNAHRHSVEALQNTDYLGAANTRTLIGIAVSSLLVLDRNDEAAIFIVDHFDKIEEAPELGIFFADAMLKSSRDDKVEKAVECVTQAFAHAPANEERLYLSAFPVLNELCTLGGISLTNQETVCEGHFVKIEGLASTWFYTGEDSKAFGATAISESDPRYQAVVSKSPGEEVDWPADKYSTSRGIKKIAYIFGRNAYFYAKSYEVMQAMAEKGDEAIWAVEVLNEDGSLNQENLLRFHREELGNQQEFFKTYCEGALPFAMLCRFEGSIHQALSRICTEDKGFVRCNDGTTKSQEEQYEVAKRIVEERQPFFIDSLAALMLCESGLLQTVIEKLSNIRVSTSVIKTLRDVAEAFRPNSSAGRMGFVGGRLRFAERNKESDAQFRQKLLSAANMLDNLPNKSIGSVYEEDEDAEIDLNTLFPSWMADTVRLAEEEECLIVTDDALALKAYAIKEGSAPLGASSLALIRCLNEQDVVTWDQYLRYFRLLSSYRYFHLPISVDDMEQSVLGTSKGGLILFTPKNIDYLNLGLTFATEYGVEDKVAIRVAAVFFSKVIMRNDVTESMAEEIFSRALVGVLAKRDAKLWGRVIVNLCKKFLEGTLIASPLAHRKLSLLEQQILSYAHEFNPIIQDVPSLLKVNKYD